MTFIGLIASSVAFSSFASSLDVNCSDQRRSLWAGAAPAHIPCLVVSLPLRALPFPPRSLPRGDRDPHTQYRPISTNFNSFILFDRVTSPWPWCPENGSWQRRLLTEWNFCRLESNYLKTPLIPEQKPLIVEFSVTRGVKLPPRHLVCRSTKEFIVWRCAALRFHKSSQRPTVCVGRAPAVTDREGIASKLSIWSGTVVRRGASRPVSLSARRRMG